MDGNTYLISSQRQASEYLSVVLTDGTANARRVEGLNKATWSSVSWPIEYHLIVSQKLTNTTLTRFLILHRVLASRYLCSAWLQTGDQWKSLSWPSPRGGRVRDYAPPTLVQYVHSRQYSQAYEQCWKGYAHFFEVAREIIHRQAKGKKKTKGHGCMILVRY